MDALSRGHDPHSEGHQGTIMLYDVNFRVVVLFQATSGVPAMVINSQ